MGIGFLLLWLSFYKLDLHEVWNDVKIADYNWMIITLLCAIASHIFRALRWNLLINSLNYKTKLSSTFFAIMVGYLANTAVPRMGELARCGVLSKKEKIPFNTLFGTVISERVFDLVTLLFVAIVVIMFQFSTLADFLGSFFGPFFENLFSNIQNILVFTGVSIIVIVIFFYSYKALKHRLSNIPFFIKLSGFTEGLLDGIKTIMKLRQKWLFLFYTFVIWLFYALMVYFPVFMLPETSHLTFVDALIILVIGSLGIIAPVPGGIGAYHFIVKAVLVEIFHIGSNSAGSFAAITHAGQTILNVVVGTLSYFYLGFLTSRQKPLNE